MGEQVSVVVPVGNAAPHLSRCVTSLTTQTHTDLQILLVDDDSDDGSLAIATELATADSRIRVLTMDCNVGPAAARNRGLLAATGTYVTFLDADDWAEPDLVEQMVESAETNRADVVIAGAVMDIVDADDQVLSTRTVVAHRGKPRVSQLVELVGYVWNKLYRLDYLIAEGAEFPDDVPICEDLLFNGKALTGTERLTWLRVAGVHHVERPEESLSTTYRPDLIELRLTALAALEKVLHHWMMPPASTERVLVRQTLDALRDGVRLAGRGEGSLRSRSRDLRRARESTTLQRARTRLDEANLRGRNKLVAQTFFRAPTPALILIARRWWRRHPDAV